MKHSFSALIFDVDGTLAETEELHRKAFNDVFKNNGLKWHWDKSLYAKLLRIAGGKERIQFYQTHFPQQNGSLSYNDVAMIHKKKTEMYASLVEKGSLTLRPGISSIITAALEQKICLAVATSTSYSNLVSLTKSCFDKKPEEIFTSIATGNLVKQKKPAPDLYNLVLKETSLNSKECLAIEDSRIGLMAAKGANIPTLVSPSIYHIDENFSEADYTCVNLERKQLPKKLRQLLFNDL